MGKILDFFRKKKNKSKEISNSFADRILRHRLTILYRTILIVVCIAALVWIIVMQMRNRVFETWQEISSSENTVNTASSILTLGDCALVYSHDGAYCLNKKGDTVWNQTYQIQEPIVDIRGSEAAIADYNGHTIYVMNSHSISGSIDTGMPIKNIAVSANGVVAAVLDDSDNVTWIYLFDDGGNVLAYFKTTMAQSGYPLRVSISDNGTLVAVSYLYMDSTVMRTSVAFYNFGPVGRNEIDNFVSSYDYTDAIIPFLRFLGNDAAVAVGDARAAFYEGDQKPISTAEVLVDGEIRGVYWGSDNIALVFNDVSGQALYRIDIYDKKGARADSIYCDLQYTDMFFVNDKIVIYNSQECIYHTIGGHDNFTGDFPEQLIRLIPLTNAHEFMAVSGNGVKVLRLR